MTKIGDQARLTVRGSRVNLSTSMPLEDQCRAIHAAMLRRAQASDAVPWQHQGKPGVKAHLNMSLLVRGMAHGMSDDDRTRIQSAVGQVLRKTGAAVCLHRHNPHTDEDPVWFVAHTMPETLVVVAQYTKSSSAGIAANLGAAAAGIVPTWAEKRLRPEEAGENLPPGPVTVTHKEKETAAMAGSTKGAMPPGFAQQVEARQAARELMIEHVLNFVRSMSMPMTNDEITTLIPKDALPETYTNLSSTTIRPMLNQLVEAGKIFTRQETANEKRVRGGGDLPMARRSYLFFGSDPVPERTALPEGIKPFRSAKEVHSKMKETRDEKLERIYRILDVPNRKDSGAPRSIGVIAKAAGLPLDETRSLLETLVSRKRVFYRESSCTYTPMDRVRRRTLRNDSERAATADPLVGLVDADLEPEDEVTPEALNDELPHEPTHDEVVSDIIAGLRGQRPSKAIAAQQPDTMTVSLAGLNEQQQRDLRVVVAAARSLASNETSPTRMPGDVQRISELTAQVTNQAETIRRQAETIQHLKAAIAGLS